MLVKGVSLEKCQEIAESMELKVIQHNVRRNKVGNFIQFGLRPKGSKYQLIRNSMSTKSGYRKVNAVCWHGFRDFFGEIYFHENIFAKIRTAIAKYDNVDDFKRKYPATGYKNIGSIWQPLYYRHACRCVATWEKDFRATGEGNYI